MGCMGVVSSGTDAASCAFTSTARSDRARLLYSRLPQVGAFLDLPAMRKLLQTAPRQLVVDATRRRVTELRSRLQASERGDDEFNADQLNAALAAMPDAIAADLEVARSPSLRRVINASGVLLQTNLGRAPLSKRALERIAAVAQGYCNLEYDLASGERGERAGAVEDLILRFLRVRLGENAALEDHAALIVNNCAAAMYLALNTLAEGGEVIVSRGELVEIGGGFRIPEILDKSGATLREVGTTNRTRVADYAAAITPATRLLLRVHRSNFRMDGFTEQPSLAELVALGERAGVPVFEDQGTGCAVALEGYGIREESNWPAAIQSGAALVTASGDKLLGGPQCGLLLGRSSYIEGMRSNPFYRAFRADKLTYAALEGTLLDYLSDELSVPVIRMLSLSAEQVGQRCKRFAAAVQTPELEAEIVPTSSVVGGGTTPGATLPSYAVALRHVSISDADLSARLRTGEPPIVTRIRDGQVLLDLRTVAEVEEPIAIAAIRQSLCEPESPGPLAHSEPG